MNKAKGMAMDIVFSVAGIAALNGVIQLVVYPYLNRTVGTAEFGKLLYYIAIATVIASSFGTGAGNARMVESTKRETKNGDYNIFLMGVFAVSACVCAVSLIAGKRLSAIDFILFLVFIIAIVLRYYCDVEFKLGLRYKKYFAYYIAVTAGYIIGMFIYNLKKEVFLIPILGEGMAFVFIILFGTLFKKDAFKRTEFFSENIKSMLVLSFSYLVPALVLNSDRIITQLILSDSEVAIFYTASLTGKMIALVTAPLNGVIIGYLSKYKGKFTVKMFLSASGALVIVGIAVLLFCNIASHILIKILYPDIFAFSEPYFFIANTGQVLFFICETLLIFVLRFAPGKYQINTNIIYAAVFLLAVIPSAKISGLNGLAVSMAAVNAAKYILIVLSGIFYLKKQTQKIA